MNFVPQADSWRSRLRQPAGGALPRQEIRKAVKAILVGLLILLTGCAAHQGVPNFATVEAGIYRGGQPDANGWRMLRDLGVTTVVKLNAGREEEAEAMGMNVYYLPISAWQQTLGRPSTNLVAQALAAIETSQGPCFIHCTHGRDRTGLIVGVWRVEKGGWSKSAARAEMKAMGFRSALPGLNRYWKKEVDP